MRFIIRPYTLSEQNGVKYCYSNLSSAKITHPSMVELLSYILEKKVTVFTEEEINVLFQQYNLPASAALKFLQNDLSILISHQPSYFQHLYIFCDNTEIRTAIVEEFSQHYGVTLIHANDLQDIEKPKSLVLLFNEQYQEEKYRDLYGLSHLEDTYFITAYLADKYLIIDNIYNKQKGVPCHFCAVDQLKMTAMTSPELAKSSWLMYYRELLKNKTVFFPASPLTSMAKHFVIYNLCRYIKLYLDPTIRELHCDHVNEFWHVDLEKSTTIKEAAIHWELCACMNA